MCGRTRCKLSAEKYCQHAGVPLSRFPDYKQFIPIENCSPGTELPVLVNNNCGGGGSDNGTKIQSEKNQMREIKLMKWGLVPSYTDVNATRKFDYFRMFNARSETACEKSVFSRLVKSRIQSQSSSSNSNTNGAVKRECKGAVAASRRCVVIIDGFYEWKSLVGSKTKQPYYITLGNRRKPLPGVEVNTNSTEEMGACGPMKCACLYDVLPVPDPLFPEHTTGHYSFTMLTVPSNAAMRCYHHRQPLILTDGEVETWLTGRNNSGPSGAVPVVSRKRKVTSQEEEEEEKKADTDTDTDAGAVALLSRYTESNAHNESIGFTFVPVTPRVNKSDYQGGDCSEPDNSATDTPSLFNFFTPSNSVDSPTKSGTSWTSPGHSPLGHSPTTPAARHSVTREDRVVLSSSSTQEGTASSVKTWNCFVCQKAIPIPNFSENSTETEFINTHVNKCLEGSDGHSVNVIGNSADTGVPDLSPPREQLVKSKSSINSSTRASACCPNSSISSFFPNISKTSDMK